MPVPPGPKRARSTTHSRTRLHELLSDLGSQVHLGDRAPSPTDSGRLDHSHHHPHHHHALDRCSTGLAEVDELLGGGFQRGCLSEIAGPPSSGRTSLALALLAETTRRGCCAGVVDLADAFDPASAEARGVALDHILWARVPGAHEALRCAECLLQTEGFPLVLLDWTRAANTTSSRGPANGRRTHRGRSLRTTRSPDIAVSDTAWLRLSRLAAATGTALVLVSETRLAGSNAGAALELTPARPRFTGSPALLEELETHAVLVRHRARPVDRTVLLRLSA